MASDRIEIELPNLISEELDEIGRDCGVDNWDSYGAVAIKPETVELAKEVFKDIWICPSNDGSIGLSFHDEKINLEIQPDGSLHIIVISDVTFDVTLDKVLTKEQY